MIRVYGILAEAGVLGTCARFLRAHPEHRVFRVAQDYVGSDEFRELRVTPKQKLILRLRQGGKNVNQIATIMGITERAAYALLARARESAKRLRDAAMEFLEDN